jgi:two-component system chemotaxis response regulator CheY
MKILVIDDSKAVHSILVEMLAGSGIQIDHGYNGREGFDAVTHPNFHADLVLMDWEMPVMTGVEAVVKIRESGSDVPIVMMTSKNSMADISEALAKGATDYMIKPFTRDIIIGKIVQVTGKVVA